MNRLLSALIVCALLAVPSFVEAAAVPLPIWLGQFDALSQPLSGGKVYTYAAGTTTPKATWTNAAKTATSTNPIVLGSNGRAVAYGDGLYKIVVKDSAGVVVTTVDNVELVSAVSPSILAPTELTVASATISRLNIYEGWIASAVVDSSHITNSDLTNCKITANPFYASEPVPLGYLNTQVASLTATITAHVASSTNPHGPALVQTNIRTHAISNPDAATVSTVISPMTEYGAVICSPDAQGIGLASAPVTSVGASDMYFWHRSSDGEFGLKSLLGDYAYWSAYGSGTLNVYKTSTIDFNGAVLKNYVGAEQALGVAEVFGDSGGVPRAIGSTTTDILQAVCPASFTAGYYLVETTLTIENTSGTEDSVLVTLIGSVMGGESYYQTVVKSGGYATVTLHTHTQINPADVIATQISTLAGTTMHVLKRRLTCIRLGSSAKAY